MTRVFYVTMYGVKVTANFAELATTRGRTAMAVTQQAERRSMSGHFTRNRTEE